MVVVQARSWWGHCHHRLHSFNTTASKQRKHFSCCPDGSKTRNSNSRSAMRKKTGTIQELGFGEMALELKPGVLNRMPWTRKRRKVQPVVCLETNHKMQKTKNKKKPEIVKLRQEELAEVLRWSGSGEQILEKIGGPPTWMTRVAVSLAGAVVFYNYNTLAAAIASLYWAWDPIWTTVRSNSLLRLRYPYAGIWNACVLYADLRMLEPLQQQQPQGLDLFQEVFEARPAVHPLLHLIIGDESSATLEMKVKVPAKTNTVQVGEPVQVLVLSDERNLSRFIALHDVYLPNKGIWMSDSPCVEREAFEYISESLSFSSMPPPPSQKQRFQTAKSGYEVGYKSLPPKRPSPAFDKLPASIELQLTEERYQRMMDLDDTLRAPRKLRQISTFDDKFERLEDRDKVYPLPRQSGQVRTDDRRFGRRLEDTDNFQASRPPLQRLEKKVERLLDKDNF